MRNSNLKPWRPGVSGNPKGRPKGSRSWSKVVNGLLNDEQLLEQLYKTGLIEGTNMHGCRNALELISVSQITKAINGDYKATEWLRKIQYDYDLTHAADDDIPIALVRFIESASTDELRVIAKTGQIDESKLQQY
jgi:hypothetical protein